VYDATSIDGQGWKASQLIDPQADNAILDQLSPIKHVSVDAPPTFLLHTSTDAVVPPEHAAYYGALRAAKVPVEMHIFENGAHGLGFPMGDAVLAMGPVLLENWLRAHRLLGRDVE
jgi:dipeptidyl aminopeptidase/acylaminoacyl peptidase